MKKFLLIGAILLMLVTVLAGCIPPHYSKQHKKELTEKYTPEVTAWFAKNKAEAEVKKCEALTNGTDLFAAMKGAYRCKGKTFQFIYDWYHQKMYVEEGYTEVCHLLTDQMASAFDLDPERTEFRFWGYDFNTHLENDDPDERYTNQPDTGDIPDSEIIPADVSIDDFAEKVLSGEEELLFTAYSYVDNYPAYEQVKMQQYQNLNGICYFVPMEGNFDGIYRKDYRQDGVKSSYAHIREINEYISAGYTISGEGPGEGDILTCSFEDRKNFTLTIPDAGTPILFSKKNKDFVNHFINPGGQLIENELDDVYREDCLGNKDYKLFYGEWVMNDDYKHAYRLLRNVSAGGVYRFRID